MNKLGWIVGGIMLMGKTEVLGQKPVPVPLCPLVWDGVQAPPPGGERSATAHTMAQPRYGIRNKCMCSIISQIFTLVEVFTCFKIVTEYPREVSYLVTEEGFL